MFTGLIHHTGKILELEEGSDGASVLIQSTFENLKIGESISVDGICLTITDVPSNHVFSCDLSEETLQCTLAADYQKGDTVNLERSLSPTDLLGGHLVHGHIDAILTVDTCEEQGNFKVIRFKFRSSDYYALYLIPKGSIAINGVSVTLNNITASDFSVTLIPQTLAVTNLNRLKPGIEVNVEFDLIAKVVAKQAEMVFNALQSSDTHEHIVH